MVIDTNLPNPYGIDLRKANIQIRARKANIVPGLLQITASGNGRTIGCDPFAGQ